LKPIIKKGLWFFTLGLGTIGFVSFLGSYAFAAEKISAGRKLYDTIMLFVNFGILAFLFIKYARKPLINFLKGESKKVAEDLDNVEEQLKNAKSILNTEEENFSNTEERIQKIREDILELGRIEKEKIIENAKQSADQMIEDTKRKSEYKLEKAKKSLGVEIMDMAVSIARDKIQKEISPEDDEALINQFLSDLTKVKGNLN
jgi:F-type H+-transporting ATPase subunit b